MAEKMGNDKNIETYIRCPKCSYVFSSVEDECPQCHSKPPLNEDVDDGPVFNLLD